ncbi:hypothetical protein [Prevotella sp.]|uniref:hypothetical protein n=1 Tax=Prevotella sp. TaxID=59823 RepID=UPI0025CD2954|nr:hypothetical protein [Prevotella sp.]
MNKYFLYAASVLALASCSSDDFLGENPGNVQNATTAINFGGEAGKITRATSNTGTPQQMLDGQFLVYGVKKVGDMRHNVFVNYKVWDATAENTTTNTKGWEYVGEKQDKTSTDIKYGSANITLDKNQTIKFWDYSASEYNFVAGSPIDAFIYKQAVELTSGTTITEAIVSKLAGHINPNKAGTQLNTDPVYIAAPVKVEKANYKEPVKFTFQRQQSMVRVGFYETIPGYTITEINFYDAEGNVSKTNHNIILTSSTPEYFVGGTNVSGTVKYDWTATDPSYTFTYDVTTLEKSKNWYAGELTGVHAKTSSETNVAYLYGSDQDMATATGYFTVLPTPATTTPSAILIKCDYTLTSDDDSGETIHVKGATAAIPATFSKWDVNTRYTYLFKISQNTNGTTGDPTNPDDPAGLYPITFDAVVTDMTDKTHGTITTVTTPSITTYQAGSVTDNGIEYKSGTAIDVTVTDANGNVQTLTAGGSTVGSVAVYKFTDAITEAEIQVKGTADATPVTGSVDGNKFTFTPDGEGYYAIRYLTTAAVGSTPAAYTYKVVYVK